MYCVQTISSYESASELHFFFPRPFNNENEKKNPLLSRTPIPNEDIYTVYTAANLKASDDVTTAAAAAASLEPTAAVVISFGLTKGMLQECDSGMQTAAES